MFCNHQSLPDWPANLKHQLSIFPSLPEFVIGFSFVAKA
jgi:hypothetical protein